MNKQWIANVQAQHDKCTKMSYWIGYWDGIMTIFAPTLVATLAWLLVFK